MLRTLILYCAILATVSATPAFSAPLGTIGKFSGDVYFRSRDNTLYLPITSVMEISEGGWIKTGKNGWIELSLIDKSRFTIANNSELELTRLIFDGKTRDGLFTLTQGKLRASVTPMRGLTSSLKVRSRSVVAGVKGTEFLMLSEGPANVFFGNEGSVAISGNDEIEKLLLPQFMTQSTRGYTPLDPVAVEPNSPVADAKKTFESVTQAVPPDDWIASDNLPDIIARWNVSYGHYLADSGKYEQALQVFQIALDLAKVADRSPPVTLTIGESGDFLQWSFTEDPHAVAQNRAFINELAGKKPEPATDTGKVYRKAVIYVDIETNRGKFRYRPAESRFE